MKRILLRCGWCGCFCDNKGNIFEATEPLQFAAKNFNFQKGTCNKCVPSLQEEQYENELNTQIGSIRSKANKYMSTGKY